eukprot:30244_1
MTQNNYSCRDAYQINNDPKSSKSDFKSICENWCKGINWKSFGLNRVKEIFTNFGLTSHAPHDECNLNAMQNVFKRLLVNKVVPFSVLNQLSASLHKREKERVKHGSIANYEIGELDIDDHDEEGNTQNNPCAKPKLERYPNKHHHHRHRDRHRNSSSSSKKKRRRHKQSSVDSHHRSHISDKYRKERRNERKRNGTPKRQNLKFSRTDLAAYKSPSRSASPAPHRPRRNAHVLNRDFKKRNKPKHVRKHSHWY